jgi:hypothetical protein
MSRLIEALERLPISGVRQVLKQASPEDLEVVRSALAQSERQCIEKGVAFRHGSLDSADYKEILRTVRLMQRKWDREGHKAIQVRKQTLLTTGRIDEQSQPQEEKQSNRSDSGAGRRRSRKGTRIRD